MGAILSYPKFKAIKSNGDPLVGGKLFAYHPGTSTPKSTYHNPECTAPQAQPIILDANGEALLYGLGSYKLILRDTNDTVLWTIDGIDTVNPADIVTLNNRVDAMQGDISGIITDVAAISAALPNVLDGITSNVLPAFLAVNTTTRNNVTGDGTAYTVPFDTEVFDQANNFAANTFTALQTGRYRFDVAIEAFMSTATQGVLTLVTSNRSYTSRIHLTSYYAINYTLQLSVIADMDAGDIAYVSLTLSGGSAKTANVNGSAGSVITYFSGSLVPTNYLTKN